MGITGGVVRYERTIKTGDYENKKAACELQFEDDTFLDTAFQLAVDKVHQYLEFKRGPGRPPNTTKADELKKSYAMNKTKTVVPPKKEEITIEEVKSAQVADFTANADGANKVQAEDIVLAELDDFAAAPETAVATTDKDLYAACTAKQKATNNPIAIRQLIGQYVKAPKGVKDIPAEHRPEFLVRLAAL